MGLFEKNRNKLLWIQMSHEEKMTGHLEQTPPPGHCSARPPAPALELQQSEKGGNRGKNERSLLDALYMKSRLLGFETVMNFNQNHWLVFRSISEKFHFRMSVDLHSASPLDQSKCCGLPETPLRPWVPVETLELALPFSWRNLFLLLSFAPPP